MSHLVYEKTIVDTSRSTYERQHEVKLPGIMKSFVLDQGLATEGWHITEKQLLQQCGVDADSHAIVVDLKPNAPNIVDLYCMRGILGFSYEDWTPVCFLLEEMFSNRPENEPAEFKEKFTFSSEDFLRRAVSFVYLRAGTRKGVWNYGKVGQINGALIFPDAWKHFHQQLDTSGWLGG